MVRSRRFTVIELLVAMSILSLLGLALVLILRGGLITWRSSEAKRESYDQAQAIFLQLRDDLNAAAPPFDTPINDRGNGVEARFVCTPDPQTGRPRLIFVRSIKAESEHPITGRAGERVGSDQVIDQRDDLAEARAKSLRATGGAMEVAWVHGKDGMLYRGVRTPIGPPASLFDPNAWELAPNPGHSLPKPGEPAPVGQPPGFGAILRPYASDVIHLEFRFWSQYTRTWSTAHPPLRQLNQNDKPGPLTWWDSTRSVPPPARRTRYPSRFKAPRMFHTFLGADSLFDPRDDVFPSAVRVKVVLQQRPAAGTWTFITKPLKKSADELFVDEPDRLKEDGGFLYIEGEWIKYERVKGDKVYVADGGRGVRNTVAADHDLNAEVILGQSFTAILDIPSYREDWGDR